MNHDLKTLQLEEECQRLQAINQAMLKTLSIGVCLLNDSGEILSLNHAGARLLGWSEALVLGRLAHDVFDCMIHESGHEAAYCPIARCGQTGMLMGAPRVQLRTRQGEWQWVECSCSSLVDVGGTGMMMTFRDLTLESQLRAESQQLTAIPEESPFPIIEVDPTGNLLYANAAMTRLMQEADIRSSGFSAAFPNRFLQLICECLDKNSIQRDIEVDVGQHQYAWLFSPHPELGLVRGFGMDISDRMLAADELSAFADQLEAKNKELDAALVKAEAATKAKAEFLATMSHEIRTPLNGVIGMTEMLMDTPLTTDQVECATIVKSSADGLLTIVNDILDFSKIEAGKFKIEVISFNIHELIEEVLDLFAERAHKKGLDLAGLVDSNITETLYGDPNRLRQVLTNFIGNAIKFTDHGEVFIEVTRVENDPLHPNEETSDRTGGTDIQLHDDCSAFSSTVCLRIAVKDTGIGISLEAQQRLFQAFSQADTSTTRKYGGTGLGLAISRQLVELMDGELGVESNEGGGSTFWCHIPFGFEGDYPHEDFDHSTLRNEHVLCIGCPTGTLRVMTRLFEKYDMMWTVVTDSHEALSLLHQASRTSHPFTTVVVDSLTSDDGLPNFVMTVKADSLLVNVTVMTLVYFGQRMQEQQWKQYGVDRLLPAPVHQTKFLACFMQNPNERSHEVPFMDAPLLDDRAHSSTLLPEVSTQGRRPSILVAEDNLVNQKVVSWTLEKLGCHVTLVGNGLEAVQKSAVETYDVILMDWQMPEMDGLEATRAIRMREVECYSRTMSDEQGVLRPIPVIGMTANAMNADRDECFAAGMSDYMSKPIRAHQLVEILKKWVPTLCLQGRTETVSAIATSGTDVPHATSSIHSVTVSSNVLPHHGHAQVVYDVGKALRQVEGDWGLLCTLIQIFLNTAPNLMKQLHVAFHDNDRNVLEKQAHQLKGTLGTLHAVDAAAVAARLEKLSAVEDQDSEGLQAAYLELEGKFTELIPALHAIVTQGEPSSCDKSPTSVSS